MSRHGNDHVINFPPLNFQCLLVLMTLYWALGCFRMAHEEGDPAEIAKLTGVGKYFNTLTTRGRVNVSTNSINCNFCKQVNDNSRSWVDLSEEILFCYFGIMDRSIQLHNYETARFSSGCINYFHSTFS